MTQPKTASILWFRRDLRLNDNLALAKAVTASQAVIPLFIWDEANGLPEGLGGAARWWLHHSLLALSADLNQKGSSLTLRRGDTLSSLLNVANETGATHIFANKSHSPKLEALDEELKDLLRQHGLTIDYGHGHLLHPPESIRSLSGQPYRVFTPFWKAMVSAPEPPKPFAAPDQITPIDKALETETLSDWKLLPSKPNWAAEFEQHWQPGERAAIARLKEFTHDQIEHYSDHRDLPALDDATSKLAAHLAFGEVTPGTIWHASLRRAKNQSEAAAFRRQLGWRDFCYGLLQNEPNLSTRNWNRNFDRFEWDMDEKAFDAWKRGMTGYPIVDAGMRQLWRHGTMHNRVRMIAASFLIKHLLIDWRHGEQYFADTLVDMDVANNPANWQWVAGSGADASPFFRIFNPILQGEKFDKQGAYVRRFVPELNALPDKYIHRPFDAPKAILEKAGIILGNHYPKPIIDHSFARQRALDAYAALKAED